MVAVSNFKFHCLICAISLSIGAPALHAASAIGEVSIIGNASPAGGTTDLWAHSYQSGYKGQTNAVVGPNASTTYTQDNGTTTFTTGPLTNYKGSITVKRVQGLGQSQITTVSKYRPIVGVTGLAKPNQANNYLGAGVTSTSGAFEGIAGYNWPITVGPNSGFTPKLQAAGYDNDPNAYGTAAGEADDPITITSSFSYTPSLDASIKLDAANQSGDVDVFATDSSIESDIDNFVQDDATLSTLWDLSLSAAGHISSVSDVGFDFELNPLALDEKEILLPGAWGTGEGSSHAVDVALANAFNAYVDGQIAAGALTFNPTTDEVDLANFSPFPDQTEFSPDNNSVEFVEGAEADIQATPLPPAIWGGLALAGLLATSRMTKSKRVLS